MSTAAIDAAFFPAPVRARHAKFFARTTTNPKGNGSSLGWRDILRWNMGMDWDWERPEYERVWRSWKVRVG